MHATSFVKRLLGRRRAAAGAAGVVRSISPDELRVELAGYGYGAAVAALWGDDAGPAGDTAWPGSTSGDRTCPGTGPVACRDELAVVYVLGAVAPRAAVAGRVA